MFYNVVLNGVEEIFATHRPMMKGIIIQAIRTSYSRIALKDMAEWIPLAHVFSIRCLSAPAVGHGMRGKHRLIVLHKSRMKPLLKPIYCGLERFFQLSTEFGGNPLFEIVLVLIALLYLFTILLCNTPQPWRLKQNCKPAHR